MFSIIIPTWNNLALLQLCVRSIRQNSAHTHQIIVHVNDGSDGSLDWVREQGLTHTASPENIGICLAVNEAAMHATQDYILDLPGIRKADWNGATWPPTLVSRRWWFKVGGYSSEFSPGMSSDNDFSMKLWHAGCRVFLGVGDSFVYHFQCKSTGKVKKNDGGRQFLNKWGMRQSVFDRYYLRRGEVAKGLKLDEPEDTRELRWQLLRSRIKRALG